MPDVPSVSRQISSTEEKIRRLTGSLAINEDSSASKYIIEEIERLDSVLSKLKHDRLMASNQARLDQIKSESLEAKARDISEMIQNMDSFTATEKNEIAQRILSQCVWDGETLNIFLSFPPFFFPSREIPIYLSYKKGRTIYQNPVLPFYVKMPYFFYLSFPIDPDRFLHTISKNYRKFLFLPLHVPLLHPLQIHTGQDNTAYA